MVARCQNQGVCRLRFFSGGSRRGSASVLGWDVGRRPCGWRTELPFPPGCQRRVFLPSRATCAPGLTALSSLFRGGLLRTLPGRWLQDTIVQVGLGLWWEVPHQGESTARAATAAMWMGPCQSPEDSRTSRSQNSRQNISTLKIGHESKLFKR